MAKKPPAKLHYRYRGRVLDAFQQEALWHIQQNTSLLLSAPTGTGKTLVADYLVDASLKNGVNVIYTAPIKALVNQKFADFSRQFGQQDVGMATGDITVNPRAPLIVMTTEIFRNMLLRRDPRVARLAWVIFDELHYLNHQERGTVWEESILLKPKGMRILGLSATVPNIEEIADWVRATHDEPVAVVKHDERAVPLRHLYFNQACQGVPRDQLLQSLAEAALRHDDAYDFKGGNLTDEDIRLPKDYRYKESTRFLDLVRYVARERLFPALYFTFSRKGCEDKATATANRYDYLSHREKRAVSVNVRKRLAELELTREEIPHFERYQNQWDRGIGVHHAGMLPVVKQLVETLLAQGLIRVLFTTETFAVGVNMPVRTVCFDTLVKYDGTRYRYLTQQEYFQMAGRAGRRGMDRQGTVLSLVDFGSLMKKPIPGWDEEALEPITSQLTLTYNITLNLCAEYAEKDLRLLLSRSLRSYQCSSQAEHVYHEYLQNLDILKRLGFVEDNRLTAKGRIGRSIFLQELLLTELVYINRLQSLQPKQLACLAASLVTDQGLSLPTVPMEAWLGDIKVIGEQLIREGGLRPDEAISLDAAAGYPVMRWASGFDVEDVLKETPIAPGDFVALCRRSIDLLRQLTSVVPQDAQAPIDQAINNIDRGVVRVRF